MRIAVLGGDGYCGWATALYLSKQGNDVAIVDNYIRRKWDIDLGVSTLTPIRPLRRAPELWKQLTGKTIESTKATCATTPSSPITSATSEPEAIVHFAEQRSAPYSMIDREHAAFTQVNNVVGTLNLLFAHPRDQPRLPPGEAGHDGRIRHAQHRHRRGLHQDRAQRPQRCASLPQAARARSITCRRCTTRTTSCSAAGSGDCAPPT